ncbi:hypothetical protein Aab01nite_84650 [Paractinoplanes abujensis]|uniref:GAF domain-containing protein n=1 Tax=Paractinoplanes abujensis TaxID=882441 RepID=A0A7W7CQX2_9ACTN|nr:GAF domain-containing protein [Actinoplanes abujensis]MBB4693089.1 GAF domain-containing protein [Actinoplanes abujensis]GID24875.1 hypothetical protein Aab01nite_84650 [Actinoplanes abujensis]
MPVDHRALSSSLGGLLRAVDLPVTTGSAALVGHLNGVLEAAQDVLQIDATGLMLLDEDQHLRLVGVSGPAAETLERGQLEQGQGPGIDCVARNTTVEVGDLGGAGAYAGLWEWLTAHAGDGHPARSVLSAPVRVAGAVVGTLNALRTGPQPWTADDIAAAEAYSGIIGVLLRLQSGSGGGPLRPGRPPEPAGGR